ncbi:MAG: O-antigen ligase family protein [Candidatus Kerfeldbacteria bacterium]|nr:O-antigen ligase family protein [Candidatus Kerfeldbacteria bacterium]
MSRNAFIAGATLLALFIGASTAVSPFVTVAGLVGIAVVFLVLRSPLVGLLFLVAALPFERLGATEVGGSTIRASQVLLLLTIGLWLGRLLLRRSPRGSLRSEAGKASQRPVLSYPIAIPVVAFVAIQILGLQNTPNLERSMIVLGATILTISVSILVPALVTTRDAARRVIMVLFVSAAAVSLFGLFQFFGDVLGLPTTVTGLRDLYTKDVLGFPRIQSTALEPLYFANYLLLPIGLTFALYASNSRFVGRIWMVPLLLLLTVNGILTVSRGGYLGLATMVVLIGLVSLRRLVTPTRLLLLVGTAAIAYVIVVRALGSGGAINLETFTTHVRGVFYGASYNERVETIDHAVQAFQNSPWVGIGPGAFGPFAAIHPYVKPVDGWAIVNNEYVELLAENGLFGLLAFVGLVLILLVRSLRAYLCTSDPTLRALLVGTLGAFVGILAQYLTFSTLYIMHVWFAIGFLVAVQNLILFRRS